MFDGIGNIQDLMKKAQAFNDRLHEVKGRLESKTATGESGGGLVKVTVSGVMRVKEIVIDPSLFEKNDAPMVADLVVCAVNAALANMQAAAQSVVTDMATSETKPTEE